jgi:hypothetical protein
VEERVDVVVEERVIQIEEQGFDHALGSGSMGGRR